MNENPAQPDLARSIDQLRSMVCGLGVIVCVVSLSFGVFVWKQTRNVASVASARQAQMIQMKANLDQLSAVANDLASYSNGHPDLMALFHNHNIDLKPSATKH